MYPSFPDAFCRDIFLYDFADGHDFILRALSIDSDLSVFVVYAGVDVDGAVPVVGKHKILVVIVDGSVQAWINVGNLHVVLPALLHRHSSGQQSLIRAYWTPDIRAAADAHLHVGPRELQVLHGICYQPCASRSPD